MSRYDNDGLTLREHDVLVYIINYKCINGFAPTIGDIADALITSRTFVRSALYRLSDKGFIRWQKGKPRTIVVLKIPKCA